MTVTKEPDHRTDHRLSNAHISECGVRRTGKRESFQCFRLPLRLALSIVRVI
jgi:3-phenylpropionate/cinnamic acid dioxygenase small subunit